MNLVAASIVNKGSLRKGFGLCGRRPPRVAWSLVAMTLLAVFLVALQLSNPRPVDNPDIEDYAQQARALAAGEGMVTRFLGLNGLRYYQQHGLGQDGVWPAIERYPLHRAVLAGLFGLFGAGDATIPFSSAIWYPLIVALTYLVGWRLIGWQGGLFAGLLAAFSILLPNAPSGLSEFSSAFLLTAILLLAIGARSPRRFLLLGMLAGLLVLGKYNQIVFTFPLLAYCFVQGKPRWLSLGALLLGVGMFTAPVLAIRSFSRTCREASTRSRRENGLTSGTLSNPCLRPAPSTRWRRWPRGWERR